MSFQANCPPTRRSLAWGLLIRDGVAVGGLGEGKGWSADPRGLGIGAICLFTSPRERKQQREKSIAQTAPENSLHDPMSMLQTAALAEVAPKHPGATTGDTSGTVSHLHPSPPTQVKLK